MELIRNIFRAEKIEYFAPLSYGDVKTVNNRLLSRVGFEPKSVIIFLVPYYSGETVNISRYAASLDYHLVIKSITERVIGELLKLYPENSFCGFGDHSPIAEAHAALLGGLGALGDNGLLINEKYGSYVFIGDILTDIEPEILGCVEPKPISECLHCGACKAACPTGVLLGKSSDCLSAITQRRGELTEGEISLMRSVGTVWGCDVCQSACPYNRSVEKTPLSIFFEDRIEKLSVRLLDEMTDDEFSKRAFAWRGKAVLYRNLEKTKI